MSSLAIWRRTRLFLIVYVKKTLDSKSVANRQPSQQVVLAPTNTSCRRFLAFLEINSVALAELTKSVFNCTVCEFLYAINMSL